MGRGVLHPSAACPEPVEGSSFILSKSRSAGLRLRLRRIERLVVNHIARIEQSRSAGRWKAER